VHLRLVNETYDRPSTWPLANLVIDSLLVRRFEVGRTQEANRGLPARQWRGAEVTAGDAVRLFARGTADDAVKFVCEYYTALDAEVRGTTRDVVSGNAGYTRTGWLFANASASRSIVSSAIFCASSTSPAARPPSGAKHHCVTVRPAGSSW
jgi:hypothetical protein